MPDWQKNKYWLCCANCGQIVGTNAMGYLPCTLECLSLGYQHRQKMDFWCWTMQLHISTCHIAALTLYFPSHYFAVVEGLLGLEVKILSPAGLDNRGPVYLDLHTGAQNLAQCNSKRIQQEVQSVLSLWYQLGLLISVFACTCAAVRLKIMPGTIAL